MYRSPIRRSWRPRATNLPQTNLHQLTGNEQRSRVLSRLRIPVTAVLLSGLLGTFVAFASDNVAMAASPGASSSTSPAASASAPTSGSGWIRFGHFVPSQGPVSVTVGSLVLGTNLVFRSVTPFVSVPAGTYTVTVRSSSATAGAPPLVTGTANIVNGGAVTAAAIASPTVSSGSPGAVEVKMFSDDLSTPTAGLAEVRVIHAVPGLPVLTAHLTPSSARGSAALTSQPAYSLSPVGYGDASPYVSVPAGTYQLKVGTAGKPSIVNGMNWPVKAGTVASIVLVETTSGPTVEVLSDAVAVASAPIGALQTGYGGTAPKPAGPLLPIALATAVLLLAGAAIRRRVYRRS
jgi:hypothetical protein